MLGADGGGENIVEVRGVAKDEDGGELLIFGEFAEELERLCSRKKKLGFLDLVF